MGILQAGYSYTPLDPTHFAQRIDYVLADTQADMVITKSVYAHLFTDKNVQSFALDKLPDLMPLPLHELQGAPLNLDDTAYIIYTSGSTGRPKGVRVTYNNFTHLLKGLSNYFQASPIERFLWSFSIAFDGAVVAPFLSFVHGGTLLIASANIEKDPALLRRFIDEQQATHILCLPSQYEILIENATNSQLLSLKTVVVAGEICPPNLPRRHYHLLPQTAIYNAYGPTEATVWATAYPIAPNFEGHSVPIGKATGFAQIYLLDPNLTPIAHYNNTYADTIGQIAICGPLVAQYANNDTLQTASANGFMSIADPQQPDKFTNVYLTGDLGRYLPDGNLLFVGRADRQVKHNGYRIELDEIENTLLLLPDIREAAVIVENYQTAEQKIIAFVVPQCPISDTEEGKSFEKSTQKRLSQQLPAYMLPAQIVCLEQMPLNPVGKIDRKALLFSPTEQQQTIADFLPQQMNLQANLQQYLLELWKNILASDNIGLHDKFFECGGTSLHAARLVSRIQQQLGQTVFIVTLFDHPTIAEYSLFLQKEYPAYILDKLTANTPATASTIVLPKNNNSTSDSNSSKASNDLLKNNPTLSIIGARTALAPYIYRSLEKRPLIGKKNNTALFILAPPRSGTSLLRLMLAGHPQLLAANELQLLHFATMSERQKAYGGKYSLWREGLVRTLMDLLKIDAPQARQWLARYEEQNLATSQMYALLQSMIGGRILLDKSPSYCLDINALQAAEQMFDQARYIQLLRHPSAVAQSFEARKMHQVWYLKPNEYSSLHLGEMIWTAAHQNISAFFDQIPADRRYTLRYEDLVKQPEIEMRCLCHAIGLPYHPALIDPYKNVAQKMADATEAEANPMSDPTLLQQTQINPQLATTWLNKEKHIYLSQETIQVAQNYGYVINNDSNELLAENSLTDNEDISGKYKTDLNPKEHFSENTCNENTNRDDNPVLLKNNIADNKLPPNSDIAIIGMSTRLAGSDNIDQFWENLLAAKDLSRAVTAGDLAAAGQPVEWLHNKNYVVRTMCLSNPYGFDADFFDLHPREAELTDPQHRLLLELAYTALEHAGYNPIQHNTTTTTIGIFGGIARNAYLTSNLLTHDDLAAKAGEYGFSLGTEKDFAITRIAYKLNLKGPAINVQTACSSSGTALHLACQSLLAGDCDMAIVAGCRIESPAGVGYWHFEGGPLSADGYCRAFDEKATGMVRGSGGVVLVLKKAANALQDRDSIYSIIKSTAINNDGNQKIGFTAPSVGGQTAVILKALEKAQLSAADISYIETHGTGTRIGDPIEIEALQQAFKKHTDKKGFCAIGSVKTNIGHLDAGACLAGIIKTSLALQHRLLPPQLHFNAPNPQIDFSQTAFFVHHTTPQDRQSWPTVNAEKPLRAGVNALGLGGTNVHVILESPPLPKQIRSKNKTRLLVWSAKTPAALNQLTQNMLSFLNEKKETVDLGNVAYTLQTGRQFFTHRCFAVGANIAEIQQSLKKNTNSTVNSQLPPSFIFMFPGGGAQYLSMANDLWEEQPYFAAQIEHCTTILENQHQWTIAIADILRGTFKGDLEKPSVALPVLFSIEYALARLWKYWGIEPSAVIGHSLGEYTAACIAGIFSLEDALTLAVVRGRLFETLPKGAMLNVPLSEQEIKQYLFLLEQQEPELATLDIAALNCAGQCVLSGSEQAIDALHRLLANNGIEAAVVPIQVAAHSYMLNPILDEFKKYVQGVVLRQPAIPVISNLSGQYLTDAEATNPEYWVQHLRRTVRFADGLTLALENPTAVLLEVGPGQTLSSYARRHTHKKDTHTIAASLRHPKENMRDDAFIYQTVGKLWALGAAIKWGNFCAEEPFYRIALPTYPFERKKYYIPINNLNKKMFALPQSGSGSNNDNVNCNVIVSTPLFEPSPKIMHIPLSRINNLCNIAKDILYELSGMDLNENDYALTFLELGFDSLFLTQFLAALNKKLGVSVQFRQLFEEAPSIIDLAQLLDTILPTGQFISTNAPPPPVLTPQAETAVQPHLYQEKILDAVQKLPAPQPINTNPIAAENMPVVAQIIQQQLQVMQQQLALLGSMDSSSHSNTTPPLVERSETETIFLNEKKKQNNPAGPSDTPALFVSKTDMEKAVMQNEALQNNATNGIEGHAHGPWKPIDRKAKQPLDEGQKIHLQTFIDRYTARTRASKQLAESQRVHLADARSITGFNKLWKEMTYQIAAERSKGSRIWDIDGNEYIDFTMGFGINLFGHNPEFIQKAIVAQLEKGLHLSVLTPIAKQVADLLCAITQTERCTFVNTGSEGVAAAVRAARTVSGRNKIAVFEGDYHGISDELLVKGVKKNGKIMPKAVSPGIPDFLVENVIVLDYNDPDLLAIIRYHAPDLAAIVVEPLTPQFPHIQHGDVLQQLRQITSELDIAFIFDELITGFRLHPRGAQGWFGIEADICSYGKILCGGLPLAAVAGKAKYLDVFDGGSWQFGDDSFPAVGVTFFGGTFVRHPLSLATALAALQAIEQGGSDLYEQLNRRTADFALQIRQLIHRHRVPLAIYSTASIIALKVTDNNPLSRLFFFMLREKGIHITERAGFLSTAHSAEDLQQCLSIIEKTIIDMKNARFFTEINTNNNGNYNDNSLNGGNSYDGNYEQENKGVIVERIARGVFHAIPLGEVDSLSTTKKNHNGTQQHVVENLIIPTIDLPSVESPVYLPLSTNQQEVWLGHQLEGDAAAGYNLTLCLNFEGHIDPIQLTQALQMLVDRHQSLRTFFEADGQQQVILPTLKAHINLVEPRNDKDKLLEQLRQKEVSLLFDLQKTPLFRATLVKYSAQQYTLLFTAHHIIADGWSLGILVQEWAQLYSAINAGKMPDLPPARQMSAYIAEKNTLLAEKTQHAQRYWLQTLQQQEQGALPVLDLPSDRPRPPLKTYHASFEKLILTPETTGLLRKTAAKNGTTLFTFLLAAFYAYLHRITAQQDLIAGVIVAGQSANGNQNLVGHCVSLLPLRIEAKGEKPFAQWLSLFRSKTLDLFEYQQTTLSDLLHKLTLVRDNSRNPLVSVVFNMDAPSVMPRFGNTAAHIGAVPRLYESFDLFFNVKPLVLNDTLALECTFNTDLFDNATLQNRLSEFAVLLAEAANDVQIPVVRLPILTEKQYFGLLNQQAGQALQVPRNECLHQLFEQQAAQTPQNIAIVYEKTKISYQILNDNANRLACYLLEKGFVQGNRVGILMERSDEAVTAILSVLKAGGTYVPLDINSPAPRLATLTADARLSLIIGDSPEQITNIAAQYHKAGKDNFPPYLTYKTAVNAALHLPADNLNIAVSTQNLAYIIYTSGSTGQPKGVMISHQSAAGYMHAYGQWPLPLMPTDLVFSVAPLTFDPSVQDIFLTLAKGATLCIAPQKALADGFALRHYLEQSRATVMQATPATWQLLIEAGWQGDRQLQIFTGGEGLTGELAAQLAKRCQTLWNVYGPTETTIWATAYKVVEQKKEDKSSYRNGYLPVGRPISNAYVYILDPYLQPVPVGVVGEIYIGGQGVAIGYMGRKDLDQQCFIPTPFAQPEAPRLYKTGDIGRWLPDGNLEYLHRADYQVKIRGHRIELGEVEAVLATHHGIEQCVVSVFDDGHGFKQLVAYIIWKKEQEELSLKEVRDFLRQYLPDYMLPSALMAMKSFVYTNTMKIDRKRLPPPLLPDNQHTTTHTYIEPETENEKLLADIWQALLKTPKIGRHDNFFDLGGHSLIAVQLMAAIQQKIGKKIPLSALLERPTLSAFAPLLADTDGIPAKWNCLVTIKASGNKPPLYIVHGAGLHVLLFNTLATLMDKEQPIYGLQAYGLNGNDRPFDRVEDMASHYIKEILQHNPEGPYYLAGYSFGGLISFEMAKQLTAMGKQPAFLGLIDTAAPQYTPKGVEQWALVGKKIAFAAADLLKNPVSAWQYRSESGKRTLKRLGWRWQQAGTHKHTIPANNLQEAEQLVDEQNGKAFVHYTPSPYEGEIHLFRAKDRRFYVSDMTYLGWQPYSIGGIVVHHISGDHHTIFTPPNNIEFAEILQKSLQL